MEWVAVQQQGVLDYWEEHPELAQQGFTLEDLQYAANVVGGAAVRGGGWGSIRMWVGQHQDVGWGGQHHCNTPSELHPGSWAQLLVVPLAVSACGRKPSAPHMW